MEISKLEQSRTRKAKRAFTTRRVPARDMRTLIAGRAKPTTGDVVLATVRELGKHRKLESVTGRRALMVPGDEIIVCYGNRYAPDQFEAIVSDDLGLCDLVAGGGIASCEVARHDRMLPPTQIMPIGLIGDAQGEPLNVADYRLSFPSAERQIKVIVVVGTAMNSGKTFTAASMVRGLKGSGFRVAGIKATGTGSGGDLWKMKDMGADVIVDFTDAGFVSTYKIPDDAIEAGVLRLIDYAASRRCEFAIVEIADGLQHLETAVLLNSSLLRERVSGTVFAAHDSLGAKAGYEQLCALGYPVMAISGQLTRSPLAMRETAAVAECPLYTPYEIQAGALVPAMTGVSDEVAFEMANARLSEHSDNAGDFVLDFGPRRVDGLRDRNGDDYYGLDFPDDLGETA